MNIEKIIEEYQWGEKEYPRFILKNGRIVVDEVIDENNHLWYVIKENGTYIIEDAQGQEVEERIMVSRREVSINTHTMQNT